MSVITYVLIALVFLALIFVKKTIVIISQSETQIIERLGKYYATLKPGINIIIPFIDRAKEMVTLKNGRYVYSNSIDLREQVYDFDRQNVITKDNIQMEINALLYFQIVDPFKAVYEINNLPNAIEKLTQTTLRNIIGEMELDQTLTSRDTINTKLRGVLDDATNKWGIKVNRVELQDIIPPSSVLRLWRSRCRQNVINVLLFSQARVTSRLRFFSLRVRKLQRLTVLRLKSKKLFYLQKVKQQLEFVRLRQKQELLTRLLRLWDRAVTLLTICWLKTISR